MGDLGKRLWRKLETPQGRSFVSDDFGGLSDEFVAEFCARNLPNVRKILYEFQRAAKQANGHWPESDTPSTEDA